MNDLLNPTRKRRLLPFPLENTLQSLGQGDRRVDATFRRPFQVDADRPFFVWHRTFGKLEITKRRLNTDTPKSGIAWPDTQNRRKEAVIRVCAPGVGIGTGIGVAVGLFFVRRVRSGSKGR